MMKLLETLKSVVPSKANRSNKISYFATIIAIALPVYTLKIQNQ